ncbi:hypothetical protein ABFS83_08G232000 [Erythranthe nasuta]
MASLFQFLNHAFTTTMAFFSILLLELAIFIVGPARTVTRQSTTTEQFLKIVDHKVPASRYTSTGVEPTECRVCLSVYEEGDEVRKLKCKHTYHKDCLDTWLQQHHSATCPLCRQVVLPEEVVVKHRDRRHWEYYDESDEELIVLRYFCTRGIW